MNMMQLKCNKKFVVFATAVVLIAAMVLSLPFDVLAASVDTVDKAEFNKTVTYVITSIVAFVLLLGYCVIVKKKETMFILLFSAVFIVNIGYAFGSASTTLEEALLANKISYVGAVFLPLCMLVIIMDECGYKRNKIFLSAMLCITGAIFFLTMTPGYTPWYYESVELIFVNGGAKLVKDYGPLHGLYFWYLALYFGLMIASIVLAMMRKKHHSVKIPAMLLTLVLANILVWFIEQKVNLGFEFLAISYIVTEMCLLSIYNVRYLYDEYTGSNDGVITGIRTEDESVKIVNDDFDSGFIPDMQDIIKAWPAAAQLTTREVEVFKELILNKKRKDIAEDLCVSENTVKKHTTNIFTKLGVSSRAEIMNMLLKIK